MKKSSTYFRKHRLYTGALFASVGLLSACGGGSETASVISLPANVAVRNTPEPAGNNCANSGTRIQIGPDANADAALQDSEITQTFYACNGADGTIGLVGPAGPTGAAGATGAAGSTGPQGATGAAGATGTAGPQGPAGTAGSIVTITPAGGSGPFCPSGFDAFILSITPAGGGTPSTTTLCGPAPTLGL
jgi:Collagen triple helix repeat (20 copies)